MSLFYRCLRVTKSRAAVRFFSSTADEVLFTTRGKLGVVELNRPEVMNALNLNMVQLISAKLAEWEGSSDVACILVKGAGKAFCAGGDVVAMTTSADSDLAAEFFAAEYKLDLRTSQCRTPYVSLLDGVTMGGGVGISVHGKYRLATERSLFAMPETAIGLIPDVGGGYFLPRLSGQLGMYLAVTGHRLKGADVYHAGVATHFTPASKISDLEDNLASVMTPEQVFAVITKFHEQPEQTFSLAERMEQINKCFAGNSIQEFVFGLVSDGSSWADEQEHILYRMSPLSLGATIRHLRAGGTLDEVLTREFRACLACLEVGDFREGVRALLVDKDNKPTWRCARSGEVTREMVDEFFAPNKKRADIELLNSTQLLD